MYQIRSDVVHKGEMDFWENGKEKQKKIQGNNMGYHNILKEAIDLKIKIVQKIIATGKEPDWGEIELSGLYE